METVTTQSKRPYVKHDFLEMPYRTNKPGVYAIMNRDNGKTYIGSAVKLSHRITTHRHDLAEKGNHENIYLLRAFRANPESFYVEILEEFPTYDKVLTREQFWIDFYRSYDSRYGYNISPVAGSCKGVKQRPEVVEKMSASRKGRKWTDDQKIRYRENKLANGWPRGWKWSDESKARHSLIYKGRKIPRHVVEKQQKSVSENPAGHNKKKVSQYALNGDFLKEWTCIRQVEKNFGRRSNIHAVCKGKRNNAFGFIWKYTSACQTQ